MKKLILMTVFSIVGFTTYAQNTDQQQQSDVTVQETQDDFKEIDQNELPSAVSDAIKTGYPTATIGKAYRNKSDQYKVDVTLEDGTSSPLYFDKDGNSIEM